MPDWDERRVASIERQIEDMTPTRTEVAVAQQRLSSIEDAIERLEKLVLSRTEEISQSVDGVRHECKESDAATLKQVQAANDKIEAADKSREQARAERRANFIKGALALATAFIAATAAIVAAVITAGG